MAKRNMKLNLGCGVTYMKGYKNIDMAKDVTADEYYDFRKGIKELDNSVDEIWADNVMEHICEEFIFVMNECWRVLKPEGILHVRVPDATVSLEQAIRDPTHFPGRMFCKESFNYFDVNHEHWKRHGKSYGAKPWHIKQVALGVQLYVKLSPAEQQGAKQRRHSN